MRQQKPTAMTLLLRLWVISFFLLTPMKSYAQSIDTIHVASEAWEGNTNEDGSGSFFDIIRAVYAMENIDMQFQIVPYERSVEMVRKQDIDAWVAAYDEEEDFAIFPEWHFDADIVTAVYKKDRYPNFSGVESLTDQTVSWVRGYAYDEYIESEMDIYRLNKRDSAIGMLVRDRIDVFLDAQAEIDGMVADTQSNQELGFFEGDYNFDELLRLKLFLAFSDTPKSRALIEIWDRNFPILLNSGEIKAIYNTYEVANFPFDL